MTKRKGPLAFLATLAAGAAISASPAARAEGSFEMGSYLAWPGGEALAAGNYAGAIDAASGMAARMNSTSGLVAATNLCVAYTVTGELVEAQRACDQALTLAMRSDDASVRRFSTQEATSRALSNRGVLRALSGDAVGAADDFGKAARQRGAWEASSRNLAHLQSSPAHRLALAENTAD